MPHLAVQELGFLVVIGFLLQELHSSLVWLALLVDLKTCLVLTMSGTRDTVELTQTGQKLIVWLCLVLVHVLLLQVLVDQVHVPSVVLSF